MLAAKNRLVLGTTVTGVRATALRHGILELPVDGEIAISAGELPLSHGDPIDRVLVATAQVRGITLMTADETLLQWRMSGYRAQDASA